MESIAGITDFNTAIDTVSRTADRNQLSREEFFKIMTVQMQQQDPMTPMESENFLNQLVSLQSLDTQQALQKSLGGLVSQQEFTTASNLIGKGVLAIRGTQTIQGQVDRVKQQDGKIEIAVAHDLTRLSPSGSVGKNAVGYDVDGFLKEGTVERVNYQEGIPFLVLGDGFGGEASIPASQLIKVTSFVRFNDIKEIGTDFGLPDEL